MSNQKIEIPANCKASITIENGLIVIECEEQKQEQKYVPSDGDFVVVNKSNILYSCIFKTNKINKLYNDALLYSYASIMNNTKHYWIVEHALCSVDLNTEMRPMTDQEKQAFIQRLNDEGYQWNEEKKCLEPFRWEPKIGEWYFLANPTALCYYSEVNNNVSYDIEMINRGLVYKTKEEAIARAKQMLGIE